MVTAALKQMISGKLISSSKISLAEYKLCLLQYAILFLMVLPMACSHKDNNPSYHLSVQKKTLLAYVAGSSGIVLYKGDLIIISDNLPGYVLLDTISFRHTFYPFKAGDTATLQDKKLKEDFENAALIKLSGKPYVAAFGSGSIESSRQKSLVFYADSMGRQTINDIPFFYKALRQQLHISTAQLNIEGSFSSADSFYLLNRGTNHLIAMDKTTLENTLTNSVTQPPVFNSRQYALPVTDSFPVAFSGACYYKDDRFLFTASIEKTTDWIADGEVAGSWVGMASLDGRIIFLLPLKDEKGNVIKQKLESLDIIKEYANGDISLLAIADNDDGQSTLFRLLLGKK